MKKKLLSILLALALVCSSVPAPVFAADGDTTTTSSQSTGETTPAANGEEGLLYLDDKGELKTHQEGYDTLNGWTTELPEGWYLVSGTQSGIVTVVATSVADPTKTAEKQIDVLLSYVAEISEQNGYGVKPLWRDQLPGPKTQKEKPLSRWQPATSIPRP